MKRLLAFFTLGLILGVTLTTLWASTRMDILYREKEELKSQLIHTDLSLTELEKKLQKTKASAATPLTIKEVELQLKPEKNAEVFAPDLEKWLIPQLHQTFTGKKLENFDLELAAAVWNEKIVTLQGRSFRLHVQAILAAPRTVIILGAALEQGTP